MCTISSFASETFSRVGFDGSVKPVSVLQIECSKPPNPKLVSDRFRMVEFALKL